MPIIDPRLLAFMAEAEQFCDLLDAHDAISARGLIVRVHRHLVRLYAAVLELPDRDALMPAEGDEVEENVPIPDGSGRRPLITLEQREALRRSLAKQLGRDDESFDIAVLTESTPEVIPVSLAQALAAIHQDLRAGLSSAETQGIAFGLWHWRTFFETSWNPNLGTALRILEALARRDRLWPSTSLVQ